MNKVRTAGGIAVQDDTILLIKKAGKFALVKGHVEGNETDETTASRELLEETGYKIELIKRLGSFNRPSKEDSGEIVDKNITMFLVKVLRQENANTDEEPVWVSVPEALNNMLYPEEKEFLTLHLSELRPY